MNQLNYMGNFITFYDFDFFDRMSSDVGVFLFKLKKNRFLAEFHTSLFVADLWRVRKFDIQVN